jgi:pimeloyl-ACP methyl ester carboxylesterase
MSAASASRTRTSGTSPSTIGADLEGGGRHTGAEQFPILGISQGGAVAVAYAADDPERVTHLILHGAYTRGWRSWRTMGA